MSSLWKCDEFTVMSLLWWVHCDEFIVTNSLWWVHCETFTVTSSLSAWDKFTQGQVHSQHVTSSLWRVHSWHETNSLASNVKPSRVPAWPLPEVRVPASPLPWLRSGQHWSPGGQQAGPSTSSRSARRASWGDKGLVSDQSINKPINQSILYCTFRETAFGFTNK